MTVIYSTSVKCTFPNFMYQKSHYFTAILPCVYAHACIVRMQATKMYNYIVVSISQRNSQ